MSISPYKVTLGTSIGVTTMLGLFSLMPCVIATTSSSSKNAVVTVGASCSMDSTVSSAHTATIAPGGYNKEIGLTNVAITCNDNGGYAIYAIGFGDDTLGNNVLHSTTTGTTDINTGNDFASATSSYSSNTSQWAMQVNNVTGSSIPTIVNNFDSLSLVPTTYTKVAEYNAATTASSTSAITTKYGAYIAIGHPAGTYTGKVKYTLVHPSEAPAPAMPKTLYDEVAALSKGMNTDSGSHFSWTSITAPTTTDPTTDTSTSGVFEWDGVTAGNGIDSNGGSNPIYFYRGILETSPGTYGSNGSANAYPNYVKLANNTCWRIVRTTSTGGVKIIYNGMWNESTSTCANATTSAQLTTSPFNNASATVSGTTYNGLQYQNIHAVGYTYSNLATNATTATPISTIFGSTGNDTTTNTNSSTIKQYLESWYGSNMTAYTSKLEGDAGYCNDRTMNTGTSWTTPLTDSDTIIPYGTTGLTEYYFGSYPRNANSSTFSPALTCPRGKVDLYSYTNNAGNGNGQLTYPVALLTVDEASLAGNGYNNSYNAYNANSYLRSGSRFWLLSPSYRYSGGVARGFYVYSGGSLSGNGVNITNGVRPVISLSSGTRIYSGSGTATNPWVVQ